MKKFYFLTAVFLSALLSSCSMLSKNEKQEISVTLDTKPLANYARIFLSEATTQDNPIQIPEIEEKDFPENKRDNSLDIFKEVPFDAFKIKVTLSGDFTKDLEKEKIITFEELWETEEFDLENEQKKENIVSLIFPDLEFIPDTKAKLSAEVFVIDLEEPEDFHISGSVFYGESEKELKSGVNKFPLLLDYKVSSWPTEGPLSHLPQIDNFWFYTEPLKKDYRWLSWNVYTTTSSMNITSYLDGENINGVNIYELMKSDEFKDAFYDFTGLSKDEFDMEVSIPYFSFQGFSFNILYYEKQEEKQTFEIYYSSEIEYELFETPVTEFSIEDVIELPAEVVAKGYNFLGWYATEDYSGEPVSGWNAGEVKTDITLYAKWESLTYTSITVEIEQKEEDFVLSFTKNEEGTLYIFNIDANAENISWFMDGTQIIINEKEPYSETKYEIRTAALAKGIHKLYVEFLLDDEPHSSTANLIIN